MNWKEILKHGYPKKIIEIAMQKALKILQTILQQSKAIT